VAEEELRTVVAWYEMQRQGLGAQFFAEVGRLLELICGILGVAVLCHASVLSTKPLRFRCAGSPIS
jgi:hypothetical protein